MPVQSRFSGGIVNSYKPLPLLDSERFILGDIESHHLALGIKGI